MPSNLYLKTNTLQTIQDWPSAIHILPTGDQFETFDLSQSICILLIRFFFKVVSHWKKMFQESRALNLSCSVLFP